MNRTTKKHMKFFLIAFFGLLPAQQILAEHPTAVTCTRREYREEYISGTRSQPGYVRTYEVDVEVPCGDQNQVTVQENIDNNDCSEGSFLGGLIGAGLGLANSSGNDRFWVVPSAATAGALIGCQIDGG